MTTLLLVNAATTLCLFGVIVMVQVVHYPLFADVGRAEFAKYHTRHTTMMGFVALPMLVELGSAVGLAVESGWMLLESLGLALVVVIWISTFAIQVPIHRRLAGGYDADLIRRLVRSNWIRTFGWGVRTVVVLILLVDRP